MLPLEPRAYLASRQLQCSPGAIEGWKAHIWDVTEGLVCYKFRLMLHTEHTHESMSKVYQESDGIYLRGGFWYLITHQKKKTFFVNVFAGLWMPGILIKFPLNNVVRKLYLAALPRQYELNTKVLDPSIEYVA